MKTQADLHDWLQQLIDTPTPEHLITEQAVEVADQLSDHFTYRNNRLHRDSVMRTYWKNLGE